MERSQEKQSPKTNRLLEIWFMFTFTEAEIKILQETNHPNVVRLYDTDYHPITAQLSLIMVWII